MSQPTLVLVEPRLQHRRGHHLSYATTIATEARRHGWRPRIVGSVRAELEVKQACEAAGAEFVAAFDIDRAYRGKLRRISYAAANALYCYGLERATRGLGPADRVLAISGDAQHLLGAAGFAQAFPGRPTLDFVMYAWELEGIGPQPEHTIRRLLTSKMMGWSERRERVRLWGQTAPIAEEIARNAGVSCGCVPLIVDWANVPAVRPAGPVTTPRVGFMGEARDEKGFKLWLAAMERLGGEAIAAGRISRPASMPSAEFDAHVARLTRLGNSDVAVGAADEATYYTDFGRLDLVVLGYSRETYAHRTSNILIEALGMGVVPVVGDQTWLSDYVAGYGLGTTFAADSVDSLVATIRAAIPRAAALKEQLAGLAVKIRDEHNVGRFLGAIERV